MRLRTRVSTGLGAALLCLAAQGATAQEAAIYAYPSTANYCPAGLQPVTIDGVICCGTPTRAGSYQDMMRHPVQRRAKVVQRARASIPTQKGIPTAKGIPASNGLGG